MARVSIFPDIEGVITIARLCIHFYCPHNLPVFLLVSTARIRCFLSAATRPLLIHYLLHLATLVCYHPLCMVVVATFVVATKNVRGFP